MELHFSRFTEAIVTSNSAINFDFSIKLIVKY